MSTTLSPLDESRAYVKLSMHRPAFLRKMASRGYRADTPEQAAELYTLGEKIAAANLHPLLQQQAKQASSVYGQAASDLDNFLASQGLGQPSAKQANVAVDRAQQLAIHMLTVDPNLFKAASTCLASNLTDTPAEAAA